MNVKCVKVKDVMVGGGFPVSIQTMWKDRLDSVDEAVLSRIERLSGLGCDILRFACPDERAAEVLGDLAFRTAMPIVADIHFDWRIALRCLDFPIAKIRINPGNIGDESKVALIADKAKDKGVAIRIGVNGGSLPKDLEGSEDRALAIVQAAEREVAVFDRLGFADVIVSMKASNVAETVKVNEIFAARHDIPLHIGVTEAGPMIPGIVKNTAALYSLLMKGIGNTMRVSLSDTMESEVLAAREILSAAGEGRNGVTLVSCPRCGRASFDTHAFASRWQERLYSMGKNVTVAVMGCVVNGPGEGKHADLGITGAGDKILIFKHGKIFRTIDATDADKVFEEEISSL